MGHTISSDAELRRLFPGIPWDEPLRFQTVDPSPVDTYACRYCLVREGKNPSQLRNHESSYGDIVAHLASEHGR